MVRLLAALLLIFLAPAANAEDAAKLRKFADSLFADEDYFRAQTEYRRILSYYPSLPGAEDIEFQAAVCSFKAGRFAEAASALTFLADRASSKALSDKCRITAAASFYRLGEHEKAREKCAAAIEKNPESLLKDRFLYLSGLSLMQTSRWKEAGAFFDSVPAESGLSASARGLSALAGKAEATGPRSPFLNGLASALVPGLGQAACGYAADGITAAAITSACLASAIIAGNKGNHSLSAAGYTLFAVFYSANVYGGANAARRANQQTRERILSQAENLRALSLE